jgi:hypothetical protein
MTALESINKAKSQIAEIQSRIDSGELTGAAAERGREEIGQLAMIVVATELLSDDDSSGFSGS